MEVNGKLETLLNLALEVEEETRRKSAALGVGFDEIEKTWELIVKYNGDLSKINTVGMQAEELIAGYAIVRIKEQLIQAFTELDEVEYVEKPKRLYFSAIEGKNASCALNLLNRPPNLGGGGTLIGVIDSGLDYQGVEFRKRDGTSRVLYLWDQSLTAESVNEMLPPESLFAGMAAPPEGFQTGVEFNKIRIDAALAAPSKEEGFQIVPSRDTSGHGTAVTTIAAATGVLEAGRYTGMAPESNLIIVKLGFSAPDSFPRTTELMRALTYVVRKAVSLGMPVAINLSFGNTYGSHDGGSILERFIDNVSEIGKNVICVGTGNEGAAGGHVAGKFGQISGSESRTEKRIELNVAGYQSGFSVQFWKEYTDRYEIVMIAPTGREERIETVTPGKKSIVIGKTRILIFVGEPNPYSVNQEIYFDFIPEEAYVDQGIWTYVITPVKTVNGNYDMYLPSSGVLNAGTVFFTPTPEKTLTIPSTASRVISVGAYDVVYESYADFSGRGYILQSLLEPRIAGGSAKPDIAAPGVNIRTVVQENRAEVVSGTSFATPFVTGAAALLMEWGIVKGNDRYLYGEKVKAYLRNGAREIRGERAYPNARVGYGALCVEDSIPE